MSEAKIQILKTDTPSDFIIDLEYDIKFRTRISLSQGTVHLNHITEQVLTELIPLLKYKIKDALEKSK